MLDPDAPMTPDQACEFVAALAALHLNADDLDPGDENGTLERALAAFNVPAIVDRAFARNDDGVLSAHDWLTPPALHALIDQHRRHARPVPTALPCPDWCADAPGHPFDVRQDGNQRVHRRIMGERRATCVALIQIERTPVGCAEVGPTDLGMDPDALTIALSHNAGTGYLTANGARRIAADLIAAAAMLDAAHAET